MVSETSPHFFFYFKLNIYNFSWIELKVPMKICKQNMVFCLHRISSLRGFKIYTYRFEVPMAVKVSVSVFWVLILCALERNILSPSSELKC
jgi:hypothetical protein